MSSRSVQILSRFPAHFEATRPDKQLAFVTEQLTFGLDLLSTDLAEVRRAHRLAHADTVRDLLLLAGLHGIGNQDIDVLRRKQAQVRALAAALDAAVPVSPVARDAAAATLLDLFALDPSIPRLARFTPPPSAAPPLAVVPRPGPPPTPPDPLNAAAHHLADMARAAVGFGGYLDALRARVGNICRIHSVGNGTVRALLDGAANALDLDLDEGTNRAVRAALQSDPGAMAELHPTLDDGLFHSKDLFWHSSFVTDRMALPRPFAGAAPLATVQDVLGIEENPLQREYWPLPTGTPPISTPAPEPNAGLFQVQRRGFGRELLQIAITGVDDKTVGPMLVNRDEGTGIGWFGSVPSGKTLLFTEDGRALLDGTDVTANAYSWQGACFALSGSADDNVVTPHDFVFDGPGLAADDRRRIAHFAVASPPGALDREAVFPHAGDAVQAPGIGIGRTRLAFFVQLAHLSGDRTVTPRPLVAFAGDRDNPSAPASVFAPDSAAPPMVGLVGLSWREHEAYAVRLLIPKRFALLDVAGDGLPVTERVRLAIERFRPVGVEVRVEYIDDRWLLGDGFLSSLKNPDPNMELRGGTVLWSPPPPPSP